MHQQAVHGTKPLHGQVFMGGCDFLLVLIPKMEINVLRTFVGSIFPVSRELWRVS